MESPLKPVQGLFICLVLALLLSPPAVTAAPISGTKSVGPTGDYISLTAAIADIQAQTLGGALVLELQATYLSGVETFPLTLSALNGASVVNTLTIRPASGATALSISSADTTTATVDLNSAKFVTIDGRPGGMGSHAGSGGGSVSQLTIENTSTTGVALRFINEASGNTLRYTTLRGVNTSASSGTVLFSTTTGANGNDNNTLDHCDIREGASTPANGIYSFGSTSILANYNSGNSVSSCNVFNFYAATAVDAAGVRLETGNTDWIITGNSFYQTSIRAAVGANVRAIYVYKASGNYLGENFTVSGNFIGGSEPNAGGAPWTTTGTSVEYLFRGIQLFVGSNTPSSVQGNTIQNIVWTSSSSSSYTIAPGVWNGISVGTGFVNIGTVTGNIIGSETGTDSVTITMSGTTGFSYALSTESSYTITIANNTVGSITTYGSVSSAPASLIGIKALYGTPTIRNNIVGSTTTANSLNAATSSTAFNGQEVIGILSSCDGASITNNIVANLNNNYIGTGNGRICGIHIYSDANIVTGNTVRNLTTTSRNTNATISQSACGINMISIRGGCEAVSQNIVHSLANMAVSAAVSVTGIYFDGVSNGTPVIARNQVHSLTIASTSASSQLNGMQFVNGAFTAQNNMVRVGLQADGTSTAGVSIVRGIFDNGTSEGRNFYHNSIYLGGIQTSGASSTFAFRSSGSANARAYQNNIIVNARSNSSATSKHYAVFYSGANFTGLTAGGNIFFTSGTGGVLSFSSSDRTTLTTWQAATGQDTSSVVMDPLFTNPIGTAVTGDLHLLPSNPAEAGGISIAAVTDDFDGQTRSALTPADIGADAGNFTALVGDIYAPAISYPLLSNRISDNRVLSGWAAITDGMGVSSGANAPRLYFKKATDADVFGVANNSTGNGWKYVTATGSSLYSFTLDYSLMNGGGVTPGDVIQYFVVAQDVVNNLASRPAGATSSVSPPVQNVNGHGAVNSFSILTAITGSKTVGTGGDYPSLSGTGGLFAALAAGVVTGNVVVHITSDLTETGSVTLNPWKEEGSGNYTLTIQPDSATMRTISGSVTNSLITLNGVNRVTIDGRFSGSGRYLTFRNSSNGTSTSTVQFVNDASHNTVRDCIFEGAGSSYEYGVINFGYGSMTGNDNNLITGCQVRDLSNSIGVPKVLISSPSNGYEPSNSSNTLSNNELFNFDYIGIYIRPVYNELWTISGNEIYEVKAATSSTYGIRVEADLDMGTNTITGNYIHDLLTTNTESCGIFLSNSAIAGFSFASPTTTITGNRITALNANAATTTVVGIYTSIYRSMALNVVNNQITLRPAEPGDQTMIGIDIADCQLVNVFYNSIVIGGVETGTGSSWASMSGSNNVYIARNNLFLNLRTGGAGNHFAVARGYSNTYTASHNVYAGTGATAANFMSTDYGGTGMSFATWQSSIGDANSRAGIAGSGLFTSALFANIATGDLHLANGGNALATNLGTPVSGVSTDYDGEFRRVIAPTIGADEIPLPDIAVTQSTALTDSVSNVPIGTVILGSNSAPISFTITNSGTADLAGLVVTMDGADSGDFIVSALSGTSIPVGAGTATFTVTFSPSSGGAKTAALHIASNVTGAKNPFDIVLTGLAYAKPTVTAITPSSGITSGGRIVTITGTDFTGDTAVTIGGAAATSVNVLNATTLTAITPAGTAGSASVLVTNPGGTNAANTLYTYVVPIYDIAVSQASPLTDNQNSVAFGRVKSGSSSAPLTFTITNPGTADLTSLVVTTDGPDASAYTLSLLSGTSIAAGTGAATFTVTFSPRSGGVKTTVLHIASNVSGAKNPFDITLTGNAPVTAQAAQTLDFTVPTKLHLAESPLTLIASSSSGLPVSYALVSGPATLSGDVLTFTGTGAVKVRASQSGNADFLAAVPVERTITVAANPSTLTLANLSQTYTGTPRPITVLGAVGEVDVTYKVGSSYVSDAPINVGSYAVKAVAGSITKTGTLVITQAPLFVQPYDQRKFAGQVNPALGFSYSGFLGGDNAANSVSKAPVIATTASATSAGGLYPITASGGTSANYLFVYQKGTMKVETFAAAYEVLLVDEGTLRISAKLELTVAASSKTFTGKLTTPTETAALSLKGTLTTNTANETASGTTTVKKGENTYLVEVTLPLTGDFTAEAKQNGVTLGKATNGQKLLTLAKGQMLSYIGTHSALLAPATGVGAPAGAGWAVATIDAKGLLKFTGKLADGTGLTASLAADVSSDPGYRLFIQPYTPARTGAFVAGAFTLKPQTDEGLIGRRYVAFEDAADLTWVKAERQQDSSYRAGFGPVDTRFTLDPWLPPVPAKGLIPAITLAQRLGLSGPANEFTARHSTISSPLFGDLPITLALIATNAVSIVAPTTTPANSTKWKVTIAPATGAFVGSFELNDDGKKRSVPFAGMMRQSPSTDTSGLIGDGNFQLPSLTPAPNNEVLSGEVGFER